MSETVITLDGAVTLYDQRFDEHYHSVFGAVTESAHIFIREGLQYLNRNPVSVFEIGFGTGLNAYLALLHCLQHKISLTYYAIEKFPLPLETLASLNYPTRLTKDETSRRLFLDMHDAPWDSRIRLTPFFFLHKIQADITLYKPDFGYDLVFFDAFSPKKQPEVWTFSVFESIVKNLQPGGILTTYCTRGEIKRTLKEAGLRIEIIPGPPGKRHMLRAIRNPREL
jgi:tRNA U34 5-methylaminomethyl-2-thiouridine-forming methyltransferase MnmC